MFVFVAERIIETFEQVSRLLYQSVSCQVQPREAVQILKEADALARANIDELLFSRAISELHCCYKLESPH